MDTGDEIQQLKHTINGIKANEANTENELVGLEKKYYERTAQLENELIQLTFKKAKTYKRLQELRGPTGNHSTVFQSQPSSGLTSSLILPLPDQAPSQAANTTPNLGELKIHAHINQASQADSNPASSILPDTSGQALSLPNMDSLNQWGSAIDNSATLASGNLDLPTNSLVLSKNGPSQQKQPHKSMSIADARLKIKKYVAEYPNVVQRNDGKWVELRCHMCNTNVNGDGSVINGISGFIAHLHKHHKEDFPRSTRRIEDADILKLCAVRTFSEENINDILEDLPSAPSVTKHCHKQTACEMSALKTWIDKWPTIFCHADGTYVELRCYVCSANSYKTRAATFFTGPKGFAAHLRQGHSEIYDGQYKTYEEWVVARCTFRQLPLRELVNMKNGDSETAFPYIIRGQRVNKILTGLTKARSNAAATMEDSSSPTSDDSDYDPLALNSSIPKRRRTGINLLELQANLTRSIEP